MSRWEDGDRKRESSRTLGPTPGGTVLTTSSHSAVRWRTRRKWGHKRTEVKEIRADRERENRYHKVLTGLNELNKISIETFMGLARKFYGSEKQW